MSVKSPARVWLNGKEMTPIATSADCPKIRGLYGKGSVTILAPEHIESVEKGIRIRCSGEPKWVTIKGRVKWDRMPEATGSLKRADLRRAMKQRKVAWVAKGGRA